MQSFERIALCVDVKNKIVFEHGTVCRRDNLLP